jgi:hypothetical protein
MTDGIIQIAIRIGFLEVSGLFRRGLCARRSNFTESDRP